MIKSLDFALLIPARGGSQRILHKNIVLVEGKPLIQYSIEEALKVTSEVYVSTDCKKIAEISRDLNAKVINRPSDLATSFSDVKHTVRHFLENVGKKYSFLIFIQPTSPLLKASYILEGIEKLDRFDSIISVCEEREFYWNKNGIPINYNIGQKPRTQDMEPLFRENGAFYITTTEKFLETNELTNGKVGFVAMPQQDSIDIDTNEDLNLLKFMLKYKRDCKQ